MNKQPVSRNMPERMDLPFVGLATFAGQPACTDWDKLMPAKYVRPYSKGQKNDFRV